MARLNAFFNTHGQRAYNYVRDHMYSGCMPDH